MTRSDKQIEHDIGAELRGDPGLKGAQIEVTVVHGAVSLEGAVDTYAEKWAAQDATRRVDGVRTVVQDLTLRNATDTPLSDADLAHAVQNLLSWDFSVPKGVTATVREGVVTLMGKVAWSFQHDAADAVVRSLPGVVTVVNDIAVEPPTSPLDVKQRVQAALHDRASADADAIQVDTAGHEVLLSGSVSCVCPYCLAGQENLCDRPLFTGYTRNGGFATTAIADARYAFPLGETGTDEELAPRLCAGLIGWRALGLAGAGKKIGLYGYGAAAHIIAQVAAWQGRSASVNTGRPLPGLGSWCSRGSLCLCMPDAERGFRILVAREAPGAPGLWRFSTRLASGPFFAHTSPLTPTRTSLRWRDPHSRFTCAGSLPRRTVTTRPERTRRAGLRISNRLTADVRHRCAGPGAA